LVGWRSWRLVDHDRLGSDWFLAPEMGRGDVFVASDLYPFVWQVTAAGVENANASEPQHGNGCGSDDVNGTRIENGVASGNESGYRKTDPGFEKFSVPHPGFSWT